MKIVVCVRASTDTGKLQATAHGKAERLQRSTGAGSSLITTLLELADAEDVYNEVTQQPKSKTAKVAEGLATLFEEHLVDIHAPFPNVLQQLRDVAETKFVLIENFANNRLVKQLGDLCGIDTGELNNLTWAQQEHEGESQYLLRSQLTGFSQLMAIRYDRWGAYKPAKDRIVVKLIHEDRTVLLDCCDQYGRFSDDELADILIGIARRLHMPSRVIK